MYKTLNIAGKDYKLEYTTEAALYADCVSALTGLMADIESAGKEEDIKKVLRSVSNVPQTALVLFYAGLMEAHGDHPDGDKSVPDIHAAKRLIAQYIREHKEDETGNFYGVMQICIEQMSADDFFELTGMTAMLNLTAVDLGNKKVANIPQGHKRKASVN